MVKGVVGKVRKEEINMYFTGPFGWVVSMREASARLPGGETRTSHNEPMDVRLDRVDPGSIEPVQGPGQTQPAT